jgi:hypothetical protein
MTPKRITYSHHALTRLREHRITRYEVRWLLARGVREPLVAFHGEPRHGRRGHISGREVLVVHLERRDEIHVVTVVPAN